MSLVRKILCCGINKQLHSLTARISKCDIRFATSASNANGILTSELPHLDIPKITIDELVFENIGKWENHVATKCAVTERKYTFKQLRSKAINFGAALIKKFKLNKGDVVAVLLPNVPEFPIVALGITRCGLVCTTVNPIYTPGEIARQLLDSSAKVIITLTDLWPLTQATKEIVKRDIPIITINSQQTQSTPSGAINFTEFTDIPYEVNISVSSEDVAFLPYSSGTTGLPKGVELTHSNIVSNVYQMAHPEINFSTETNGDFQENTPAVLPLFHIYGLSVLCMYQLRLGCQLVTLPKFTPDLFLGTLRKDKPSVLYLAPPLFIFLANHPTVKTQDFDCVRGCVNAAASLGPLDAAKVAKRANKEMPILQGYGLTETSPLALFNRISFLKAGNSVGSVGKPVANTEAKVIAVDDQKGTPLGPNQMGELLIKGPQVMRGYYKRPEEKAFLDGWFKTGDMVYYNEQGYIFITDRLKELIKVKGFQVAPAELEEIIRDFPDVAEAAVIGIPHSTLGEAPRAFVVPRQGATIDSNKLQDFVKEKVAPYKQLVGGVAVVDSIPKNTTGKILRRELKSKYQKLSV